MMTEMMTSAQERDLGTAMRGGLSPRAIPGVATGAVGSTRHVSRALDLIPTVQMQVIPRLHAALRNSLPASRQGWTNDCAAKGVVVDENRSRESAIGAFAERLLACDIAGVHDQIDALRREGSSLESIYLNLLAPAASRLRDLWSDDFCGLADVTLALCSLQGILRHYATAFYAEVSARDSGLRALLVAPSDKRSDIALPTFGLLLMADFFRREGWDAWVERDLSGAAFRGAVVGEWFDLVEVLATSDAQLDEISSGIRAIRRRSPNPAIGIIVCGQVFIDHPEFVRLVGADLMASDPLSSLAQAKNYVTRQAQRQRLS